MKFLTGNAGPGRCSRLVKDTAKGIAGAFFDGQDMFHDGRIGRSALFRIKARNQDEFVRTYWRDFVPVAREMLGKMLSDPGRSDADKDAIYDALLQERGAMTDAERVAPSIIQLN